MKARISPTLLIITCASFFLVECRAQESLYDGPDGDLVEYTFDSFDTGLTETGNSMLIDVSAFGGAGASVSPTTDINAFSSGLRIVYRVLSNNTAPAFTISLQDNDGDDTGPGMGTEEYQYNFDTAAGIPLNDGSGFSEQVIPLFDFDFRQKAFGFDNDGDQTLNFGLVQWQIQSTFDSTLVLNIEVRNIQVIDVNADCAIYDGPAGDTVLYTFESFDSGLSETGSSMLIDVNAFGGAGQDVFPPIEFDESTTELRVVYRVLPDNVASSFEITLRDNDGNDTGPSMGSEDWFYSIGTADGVPLGDGFDEQIVPITESVFRTMSFGFSFDGDMMQNFGLDRWQIQSVFDSTDRLSIEVRSIEIQKEEICILGDVNGDGAINLLDVTPFVSLLTMGEYQCEADINEDGLVNLLDVTPFVELITGG